MTETIHIVDRTLRTSEPFDVDHAGRNLHFENCIIHLDPADFEQTIEEQIGAWLGLVENPESKAVHIKDCHFVDALAVNVTREDINRSDRGYTHDDFTMLEPEPEYINPNRNRPRNGHPTSYRKGKRG